MSKNDDKWIKNLHDRLEDYSEPLPDGLWEQLEDELAQPKVIPLWKRWPSVAAAAVLVLATSSLVFWKLTPSDVVSPEMQQANRLVDAAVKENLKQQVDIPVLSDAPQLLAQREETSVAPKEARLLNVLDKSELEAAPIEETDDASEENIMLLGVSEWDKDSEEQAVAEANINLKERKKEQQETERRIWKENASYLAAKERKSAGKRLQIGLVAGGMPYTSDKQFNGMSRFSSKFAAVSRHQNDVIDTPNKMSAYNQVLFNNQNESAKTQVKHRLPITVAASVKWHFSENWALETGLSYTYLQSELHAGSNLYLEDTQKLHYVGIPLKIHRNIWNNSILSVYASAGGMVEKCVSGSLESTYVTGVRAQEKESVSLHVDPLQWSLAAAVGAQVNFTRALSLFVEPGAAYYFDDNSKVETIRKEHPLNFNLNFGLRFDISK